MRMTADKKVGQQVYKFTFEGKNLHEVVMESQKLAFPDVEKCGLCGKPRLFLDAYVAQGKYKYTKVVCADCKGNLTFGQRQDDADTVYLRRKEGTREYDWQAYVPKADAKGS